MYIDKINEMINIMMDGCYINLYDYYKNKEDFLSDVKLYLTDFPDSYKKIDLLTSIIFHKRNEHVFFMNYENKDDEVLKYSEKIRRILTEYQLNKQSGIKLANNLFNSELTYMSAVSKFENRYINSEVFMPKLIEIQKHIVDDSVLSGKTEYVKHKLFSKNDELMDELYESGLSLLDYAHYNKIDYKEYNYSLRRINCPKVNEIKSREDLTLPIILEIIELIEQNKINYVEYFSMTKISLYILRYIAKNNNVYSRNVSIFINNFIKNDYAINISGELESKKIINNEVVPKEFIEEAIDYLKEIDAPINKITYTQSLKKVLTKNN